MRFLRCFGTIFFKCLNFALPISAAEAAEYDYCDEYDDPKAVIIIESIGKTTAHVDFLLPQCVESPKRRTVFSALCYHTMKKGRGV